MIKDVKTIIGAHAYAVISLENGRRVDIRLEPGKSTAQSLLSYANERAEDAKRAADMARIAIAAAQHDRLAYLRHDEMAAAFLGTMLDDAQAMEVDAACTDEREPLDTGTIYDCPAPTYRAAIAICDQFRRLVEGDQVLNPGAWRGRRSVETVLGSDLYMEMAGHGVGFRDREWGAEWGEDSDTVGEALSTLAGHVGRLETYLDDAGAVWIVGKESA